MILGAEWGTGEVAWSMFGFFIFLAWFLLTIRVLWNIFKSTTLGGMAKALWVAGVLIFPFMGVFAYLAYSGDLADPVRDQEYRNMSSARYFPN